ncbi:zinc finger protein 37 isoform X2 [Folsomia candida]|uniref:zinc finger protein 37 isoform X2 n=1 Tax=Folsomia candida TaxID=158441 RepID=UPI000B8F5B55|nr:zinc finger protein 37 isoform X2 [Folsomia candida]
MSNQRCLLCLQVITGISKSPKKIKIEILCKLLSSPNSKLSPQSEFAEEEVCEFCEDCYPLVGTLHEIKTQISLLEELIGNQIQQIRTTICSTSAQLEINGDDKDEKIVQIRDMILRVTGESEEEDGFEIKVEDDDQVCDDDYNSEEINVPKSTEAKATDPDGNEDDAALCITPSTQKRSRGRPKKLATENKTSPTRTKRKREESLPAKEQLKPTKTSKLDSPTPHATRFSPRTAKISTLTPKTLVISVQRIKTSAPPPPPPSDLEDSKSNPDSDDKNSVILLSPKSENDDDTSDSDDSSPSDSEVDDVTATAEIIHPYKCISCPKSFIKRATLNLHKKRNHRVACIAPSCVALFATKKARDAHIKRDHASLSPYQCRLCGKKCRRQNVLDAHMVIKHETGEKKLSCTKCGKGFCLEENLARHLKLHDIEGIKPFVCDVCDNRFESEERLKKHLASHDEINPWKCATCGRGCNSRAALEIHMRVHSKERPEKCSQCEAQFRDKLTLERHIARAHSGAPASYICHICGNAFYLPSDLKGHLNRHEGKSRVKCDTCNKTFPDVMRLQSHQIKVHGKDPFICDECGGSFTSQQGLKLHKKIHVGDKKFKCQNCDASFIRVETLKDHMRVHTGERPFPCPHCKKAFRNKTNLRVHVKGIHTPGYVTPTPHKCSHCDKAFQYPLLLEGHIRQAHTGERPFTCEQCGKGFVLNSALTLHMKGTHGVVLSTRKDRLPRSKKDTFN